MIFFKNSSFIFLFSSFTVFIILNFIENLIHYTIGRNSNSSTIEIHSPTKLDWIRIVFIMILFGILQALFSYLLDKLLMKQLEKNK